MKKRVLVGLCAVVAVIVAGCEGMIPGDSDGPGGPGDVAVTGVTLDSSLVLGVESSVTLTAAVVPGNAANKAVTWASDNEAVATVDAETGTVTGVAKGSAVITVTSADGGKTDTCAVTVVFAVAASAEDWNSALEKISGAEDGISGNPKIFDIYITGDFETAGIPSNSSSITGSHKEVRLTGTKTIALSGTGSLIRTAVNQNQTFVIDGPTLQGNSGNNAPLVYIDGKSTVELLAGTIQDNTSTSISGGGVYVSYSGTFTMGGGTIGGNTARNGGGVYVGGGSFTMNGGTIGGNTANGATGNFYGGGGVYVVNGTFTMNGGTIGGNDDNSRNTADYGGGVYVNTSGTFEMADGTVSGNTARYGGGMHVGVNATFKMKGGTISGNTATSYGGGVSVRGSTANNATFTMAGGTISGNTARALSYDDSVYGNGGGVFVDGTTATFTKAPATGPNTSGVIYGYTDGDPNSNKIVDTLGAIVPDNGHAVRVFITSSTYTKRDATAGQSDVMRYNVNGQADTGWE